MLLVGFVAILSAARSWAPAAAAGPIQVTGTPSAVNKFPSEIDFAIDATSTAAISDVVLHYTLLPDANSTLARAAFDQATTVHAVYVMHTAGNPLYVPPMKTLRYFWTLQDSAGNQLQTDPVDWQYLDTRFTFKKATSGNLSLYYHAGSDSDAQRVLAVGRQAIDAAQALDGVMVEFPVSVVAYVNQNELAAALAHVSKSFDPNILGQTLAPDIVILAVGNLTGSDNDDTFRHELTHIVNARAVRGGFSESLPTWLDEGLAVNSQRDPDGFRVAVEQATRADRVVPIRTLTPGFEGANPDLFYGESWSIVHFLVTSFGAEKMALLLATYKAGSADDAAFTRAFGLDRDALYNAWRKSVGLSEVQARPATPAQAVATNPPPPTVSSVGQAQQQQPTVQPPQSPQKASPSAASSTDTATVLVVAIAGGAALLALAGLAVVGGLLLSRRGRG